MGVMGPMTDEERAEAGGEFLFLDKVTGGRIPKNFIPAIEKGVRNMLVKGPLAGFPVVNFKFQLEDGKYHDVDSSDMAFMLTAQELMREEFSRMKPALLEPIMLVEIECPESFQGSVVGNISSRRGIVTSTEMMGKMCKIIADIPLAETFGYSTDLRSMTQGQGTFTMELSKYRPVPGNIQIEIIAERKAELQPA
jgi:elongation factor G